MHGPSAIRYAHGVISVTVCSLPLCLCKCSCLAQVCIVNPDPSQKYVLPWDYVDSMQEQKTLGKLLSQPDHLLRLLGENRLREDKKMACASLLPEIPKRGKGGKVVKRRKFGPFLVSG